MRFVVVLFTHAAQAVTVLLQVEPTDDGARHAPCEEKDMDTGDLHDDSTTPTSSPYKATASMDDDRFLGQESQVTPGLVSQ